MNEKNIDEASLKTRILLASILSCNREELIIKTEEILKKEDEEKFLDGIERISKGYPVEYITNTKEFMKMKFFVDENVLIPRYDTEVLVEEVLKIAKNENKKEILELCTGSGIIAISLAKYLEDAKIIATDVSEEALNIAKRNARSLGQEERIKFVKSDMFEKINRKFDIIVSNPPYIKTDIIEEYSLEYEPKIALDGGEDGLKFYRIIIEEGYKYLNEGGFIILEIGYDQKEEVIEIAKTSNQYKNVTCVKDLNGNDRVIIVQRWN